MLRVQEAINLDRVLNYKFSLITMVYGTNDNLISIVNDKVLYLNSTTIHPSPEILIIFIIVSVPPILSLSLFTYLLIPFQVNFLLKTSPSVSVAFEHLLFPMFYFFL